jgi:hypothetical protein
MDARACSVVCGLWLSLGIAVLWWVRLGAVCWRCVAAILLLTSILLRLVSCVGRYRGLARVWVVWGLVVRVAGFELDRVRRR